MRGGEGEHEAQHVVSKHDVLVVVGFRTRAHGNAMLGSRSKKLSKGPQHRRANVSKLQTPNSKTPVIYLSYCRDTEGWKDHPHETNMRHCLGSSILPNSEGKCQGAPTRSSCPSPSVHYLFMILAILARRFLR